MNRFWKGIIRPIIEGLNPDNMIEIGVDKGDNTKNILRYCSDNKCKLISIDPFPDSSVSELEQQYPDEFTLLRDLSLNVLSDIKTADVYFIDGDHNWYTVFNELKTIESKTTNNFPLVFLHEMDWPYDRRDLYYNPDDIPPEYIHEYAQKGIDLHSKFLVDEYGVNSGLKNALEYGAKKSGVLTAVEDFLNETNYDLRLIKVPGFHGLGIIYDENIYLENKNFSETIERVHESLENINEFLHKMSYSFYELLNRNALIEEKAALTGNYLAQNTQLIKHLENNQLVQNQIIENLQNTIQKKDNKIDGLLSSLSIQNRRLSLLETNIEVLAKSRKSDLNKNFQLLFSANISSGNIQSKNKLAFISNIPFLFIILKSKGNIKNLWRNLKGYLSIKKLVLFDEYYYLNKYKSVLISGMNPLIHYMYYGYKENKQPSAYFDVNYYLNNYHDVKASEMNPLVHFSLYGIKENRKINKRKISVVVTSYNHENYIQECIDSILKQKGYFELEVVIGDDHSQDDTREILEKYQKEHPDVINLLPITENMGVTKNLQRCFKQVTGDYVAVCEGDDYWTDPYKLHKQANFLEERKDCALCFNSIFMYYEGHPEKNYIFQKDLSKDTFTTRDLILDNFIGNFSCCMYRNEVIKKLPEDLFDFFTVDWMFNIACSEYGYIGFLKEQMTVYRIHEKSIWSSKAESNKLSDILSHIDNYNEFFSFKYDSEFTEYKKRVSELKNNLKSNISGFQDLIILDDVFPHPLSAFRLQEYNSYLEHFKNVKIYCNPISFPALKEEKSLETIIKDYERKYPQFRGKVERFDSKLILNSKLIYTIFMANAYNFINTIDKYKIPFAFTLYPGGGFELNNEVSDEKLRRIFSSPNFRKVIVTQRIVKDYLLDNKFCQKRDIINIFGVVTPLHLLNKEYSNKKYYGIDKPSLDICFVAHRYTEKGVDKGYDVFIEVAHELSKKHDNIHFHVVGSFDATVLDITQIQDKITFYGPKFSEWFEKFYEDKDIIISPNIPFKIYDGSFDGFPTGCCTDAGLHKVAIFCTDELKLNTKFNTDEIVIIPHDTERIIEIIEYYYQNPKKLRQLAINGYLKIKELYNYENQIKPRIKLIQELIREIDE